MTLQTEVDAILAHLAGMAHLSVVLLSGSGLRLKECLDLRVQDLDFDRHQIIVRQGKGQKDRTTMLPASARASWTRYRAPWWIRASLARIRSPSIHRALHALRATVHDVEIRHRRPDVAMPPGPCECRTPLRAHSSPTSGASCAASPAS